MKRILLITAATTLFAGCTVTGHDEFTCPSAENGVCVPAEDAYIAAEQGKSADEVRHEMMSPEDAHSAEHHQQSSSKYANVAPVAGVLSQPISQPKPILEPAQVLNAWVNVWEDENQILHMPSQAFVEITPRRWTVTETSVQRFKSTGPFRKVAPATN